MPSSEQDSFVPTHRPDVPIKQPRRCIRALNDQLRAQHVGGRLMIARGVQNLGPKAVLSIVEAVRHFDAFTPDNDPHQEHDFGALTVGGNRVLWNIDYFDRQLTCGSPDAADREVTARVLTIMLAEEY